MLRAVFAERTATLGAHVPTMRADSGFRAVVEAKVRRVGANTRHISIERIGIWLDSHQRHFHGGFHRLSWLLIPGHHYPPFLGRQVGLPPIPNSRLHGRSFRRWRARRGRENVLDRRSI